MSMKRIGTRVGSALAALLAVGVIQGVHAEDAMPGMKMPSAPAAVAKGDLPGFAEISVTGEVQQRIGVTTGKAEETPLAMNIRAVGIIRPDETKVAHIHLKTEGWVEKLFVAFTGQKLNAGDPMLSIYSPAFYAAQREFLTALRSARSNPDQQMVAETARQRLELWDVPQDAIEALEKTGKPARSLIMRTPISGTVLEKKTFEGQYAMPQAELYVVADLSTVWMQAKIFEYELPHVVVGMPVTVSFPSLPMQKFIGKVVFVDPVVDEMSRSVQVRVELPNPKGEFRPGMFGQIMLTHGMGSGLTVPTSAVIRTGGRDIAFRVTSPGRFVPVQVKISPLQFEDRFQVLEGLKAGDEVVTSANFLIDSESRLEAGGGSMVGMPGMDGGGSGPAAKPEPAKKGEEGTHEHSKTKH
ncbi:efflux RND transporter periplasmic adaptor subunit [Bradyrhizobium sp. WSM2793]|uniref:efflux RND transporter periplasmic adaptor subunit n=1 Tax=Bradyrhizobium sp. WSM2793 TaxID=1038866 RepID=UPI0012F826AB|nr:efflux RND transporter periplasmic adaptor subunit [Bradyrhizobium sp. WSM2793]